MKTPYIEKHLLNVCPAVFHDGGTKTDKTIKYQPCQTRALELAKGADKCRKDGLMMCEEF